MRSSTRTLLLAAGVVAACTQQTYNPWLVPDDRAQTFLSTARTIWVLETHEFPDHDWRMQRAPSAAVLWLPDFDALVDQELRAAGYTVVRIPEFKTRLDAQVRAHGILDRTGSLDTAREANAYRRALGDIAPQIRRLAARRPLDAVLRLSVLTVPASLVKGRTAHWDGAWQDICLYGEHCSGKVPALSLCAFLADSGGVLLFTKCGGIDLAVSIYDDGTFYEDPEALRLPDRYLPAVRNALEPLLSRAKPPGEKR